MAETVMNPKTIPPVVFENGREVIKVQCAVMKREVLLGMAKFLEASFNSNCDIKQ